MNRMPKFAMAAAIALAAGSAWAAPVTGATVLDANSYAWKPGVYAGSPEVSPTTGTFHAGGVAACDGCHVMHNASNGIARSTQTAPWTDAVPAFLLQGSDQSSTCLLCHGSSLATNPATPWVITQTTPSLASGNFNYSPGGDFGWLKVKGNTEAADAGARHGHNVVAMDFGLSPDTQKTAPGGTYTAGASGTAQFACSNCHDPHGRYRMQADTATTWKWTGPEGSGLPPITQPIWSSGSYGNLPRTDVAGGAAVGAYRLLAGRGYVPASNAASPYPFPNNPPVAVAPAAYNKTEAGSGTDRTKEVRVAYGSGMSEWCQNCHTNIHLDNYVSGAMGASGLRHPAGQGAVLKPGQYNVYNTYISSGKFNGTGDLYTSLVPFEKAGKVVYSGMSGNTADIQTLATSANGSDTANIFKADAQSNVMCLSCHRAHASAFSSMVRWNADDTFITNSSTTAFVDTQERGNTALTAGYYGRTPADLGVFQRSLCNKCHGKD
jgi:hypothetical protein